MWGHRSAGFSRARGWEVEQAQAAKARSLQDRWAELTRKIQLAVEIHELNDQGDYAPVEVGGRGPAYLVTVGLVPNRAHTEGMAYDLAVDRPVCNLISWHGACRYKMAL